VVSVKQSVKKEIERWDIGVEFVIETERMKNSPQRDIKTISAKTAQKNQKKRFEIIDQEQEIFRYLKQSNISAKNLSRLEQLAKSQNQRIAELAAIVLEVGRIKPHKRRRLKFLGRGHRELLRKLDDTGLIMAHHDG